MIRLGFHLSIAGGVANSAAEARRRRYGTFQLFTSSSRAWKHSNIGREDAAEFRENVAGSGAIPYAHIPYLCNPSSPNKLVRERSLDMLASNMRNCRVLGIRCIVIHMGSHLGTGHDLGLSAMVQTVTAALDAESGVDILLENSSGYNNSVGSRLEQIGAALDEIGSKRVGVCFDTCHAFAAGYDLSNADGIDGCARLFDSKIGSSRLKLVHLNDAKYPLGSGLDRHWHIGQGYIGKNGFVELFRNKTFGSGCFIMETPVNGQGDERSNMAAAKRLSRLAGR